MVAFTFAGNEAAHALAEAHWAAAIFGFSFAMFAVCWAWINFSWFASAYDTDDWVFRLLTMLQMVGVLILSLGLPPMFASLNEGRPLDNAVMVLGYVVMRAAMIAQWLRAARQDPPRRRACLTYVAAVGVAQIGWLVLLFVEAPTPLALLGAAFLILVETAGPVIAERGGHGTPSAELLHRYPDRSFGWGYGHIVLFGSIAGTGAGLHVAAYYIEHTAHIGATATVLTAAVPVAIYIATVSCSTAR